MRLLLAALLLLQLLAAAKASREYLRRQQLRREGLQPAIPSTITIAAPEATMTTPQEELPVTTPQEERALPVTTLAPDEGEIDDDEDHEEEDSIDDGEDDLSTPARVYGHRENFDRCIKKHVYCYMGKHCVAGLVPSYAVSYGDFVKLDRHEKKTLRDNATERALRAACDLIALREHGKGKGVYELEMHDGRRRKQIDLILTPPRSIVVTNFGENLECAPDCTTELAETSTEGGFFYWRGVNKWHPSRSAKQRDDGDDDNDDNDDNDNDEDNGNDDDVKPARKKKGKKKDLYSYSRILDKESHEENASMQNYYYNDVGLE